MSAVYLIPPQQDGDFMPGDKHQTHSAKRAEGSRSTREVERYCTFLLNVVQDECRQYHSVEERREDFTSHGDSL